MDRALKTFLLVAVVATLGAVTVPVVPAASAAELDRKGKSDAKEALRFYKEGNYEDAAKIFLRLSINYPDMLVFVRNLGACYYYMRRYEPALSNLRDYLHRKTDIAADDRAEVAGWIGEMERIRDQAIAAAAPAASAAPSASAAPPSTPPAAAAPPPPPVPPVPVPTPGGATGGGEEAGSSGATASAPTAPPTPSTGAPPSPQQPTNTPSEMAPAAPAASAVAVPTPAPVPSYSPQYPAHTGYPPQDQYATPQQGYPPQGQPGYAPQGQYAPQSAYPSQGAYPPPSGSGYAQTYPPQAQTGYPQPAPSPSGVTAQAAPPPEQSSGTGRKVAAWIIGIAGLGTVAAGGYFSYKASTKFDEVEKKYDRSVEDEGKKAVLTAGVCYGVGGAAILTAIIVGAIGGSSGSVAIAPTVGPEGAGATLSGTF